jgi:hypothetical protein
MSKQSMPNFMLNVGMDVARERESLLNAVYDEEHVPALLAVPGVISIRRYTRRPLNLAIGGAVQRLIFEGEPTYTALYEIETPEVLISTAWAKAVEAGRWASEVRPFTHNRRHTLHELIKGSK